MIEKTVFKNEKEIIMYVKKVYGLDICSVRKIDRGSANIYSLNDDKYILKEFQSKYSKVEIDKEIATSLLVGIITDTNGFRNQSTNKETFLAAAKILDFGVNLSEIYMKVLSINTLSQFELKKIANNRLELFENGKIGDKLEKNLIRDIKIAHKYCFKCVVAHMDGENNYIGIERLKRVLVYARKYKIPLAIENINNNNSLDYIFENLEDEYLKFCFDSGHQHTFSPNRDILNEYGEKLVTLHLHDNDGTADQHTLNQFGNIDWDNLAKNLAKYNPVSLDYELLLYSMPKNITEDEALKLCYQNACELEGKIKKYKTEYLKNFYEKDVKIK